jgi:hypothetical protein
MTSYTLAIQFFALKPIVKKLLSIEIVIFHTFALSEGKSEKYQSQEVALNKLEKGPLIHLKTVFCSPVALMVLEKILKHIASFSGFSLPVRKILGILELNEQILERTPKEHSCKKLAS